MKHGLEPEPIRDQKHTTDCTRAKETKGRNTNKTLIDTNCRIAPRAASYVDCRPRGCPRMNGCNLCELTGPSQHAISFDQCFISVPSSPSVIRGIAKPSVGRILFDRFSKPNVCVAGKSQYGVPSTEYAVLSKKYGHSLSPARKMECSALITEQPSSRLVKTHPTLQQLTTDH
jgi:hypothetical protein